MTGGALLERAETALLDLNGALREMGADSALLQNVAALYREALAHFDGIDWPEIRRVYEVEGLGISELERRFAVKRNAIDRRARREKWKRPKWFDARAVRSANLVKAAARRTVPKQRGGIDRRIEERRGALLEVLTVLAAGGKRAPTQAQLADRLESGSVAPDLAALVKAGVLRVEHGGRKGARYTIAATGQATDWTAPPKPKIAKASTPKKVAAVRIKAKPPAAKPVASKPAPEPAAPAKPSTDDRDRRFREMWLAGEGVGFIRQALKLKTDGAVYALRKELGLESRPIGRPPAAWKRRDAGVVPMAPSLSRIDSAKRYLQSRGVVVFASAVSDPGAPPDALQVDGRRMMPDEMVARAVRSGFVAL